MVADKRPLIVRRPDGYFIENHKIVRFDLWYKTESTYASTLERAFEHIELFQMQNSRVEPIVIAIVQGGRWYENPIYREETRGGTRSRDSGEG